MALAIVECSSGTLAGRGTQAWVLCSGAAPMDGTRQDGKARECLH